MTLLAHYRNLAVKHKLRLIILFAVVAALVPASIAVVGYDQLAARRDMRNDLDVLAEIVGSNSTAAVTFGDKRAAEELLSGLKAKKHIVTAVIYSEDGKPFASYRRNADTHTPLPILQSSGSRFEGGVTLQPGPEARAWLQQGSITPTPEKMFCELNFSN